MIWPQVFLLVIFAIRIAETLRHDSGKQAGRILLSFLIITIILYFGGFWTPLIKALL